MVIWHFSNMQIYYFWLRKTTTMAENTDNQENSAGIGDALPVVGETYNPFAQHEEYSSEFIQEKLFADVEAPVLETTVIDDQAKVEEKQEVSDSDLVDPLEWLNSQWRDKGVKLQSLDDVPKIVEEYNKLLAKSNSQDLTPDEKIRLKIGRETGDWTLYDRISTIDTKSISAVDAMKTKFVLENPKMPAALAERMFEKNLQARVSGDDEEFATHLIEFEGNEAKAWLEAKKESMKPTEDSAAAVDTKEADNKWFEGVDNIISIIQKDKNRITYEFDEKEVNVDIDQAELTELRDAMDTPYEWLKDKALNEDGSYNFEKLAHLVLKDMHHDKIVKEAYELGRVHQEQHILNKNKGTTQAKQSTGAPQNNVDGRDQLAAIFKSWK